MIKSIIFSAAISLIGLVNFLIKKDESAKRKLRLTIYVALGLIVYELLWDILFN